MLFHYDLRNRRKHNITEELTINAWNLKAWKASECQNPGGFHAFRKHELHICWGNKPSVLRPLDKDREQQKCQGTVMISLSLFCPLEREFGVKSGKATQTTQWEVGETCNTHIRSGLTPLICVYPQLHHCCGDEQDIYESAYPGHYCCAWSMWQPVMEMWGECKEMLSNENGIGFR